MTTLRFLYLASLLSVPAPWTLGQDAGQDLFLANCAECHQANGQGIDQVYPALDGSETVRGSGIDVALVLIIGRGEMPSFKGSLSAQEMASIINFVRNAWSNNGRPISAEDIRALQ